MKKLLIIVLALVMVFTFAACGNQGNSGTNGMPSPMADFDSLAEMNEAAATEIVIPESWEVSDESFATCTTDTMVIGQYQFSYNGYDWCLRSAQVMDEDISGVYLDGALAFEGEDAGEFQYKSDSEIKVARWMNLNGQFTVSVNDGDAMKEEDFLKIANELAVVTNPAMSAQDYEEYYANCAGEWQDMTSQRAVLDVTANGADSMTFLVSWGSSADETTQWQMTVTLQEDDGLLYYTDCVKTNITFDESGEETVEVLYTDGEGYFANADGILCWDGAAEEDCTTCEFEKID